MGARIQRDMRVVDGGRADLEFGGHVAQALEKSVEASKGIAIGEWESVRESGGVIASAVAGAGVGAGADVGTWRHDGVVRLWRLVRMVQSAHSGSEAGSYL